MKETGATFLITAMLLAGCLFSPLYALDGEIPSDPEPPVAVDESTSVESPVSPDSESEAVTETESVVEDSGGTVVAAEETVTITPMPKKKEVIPVKKGDSFYDKYIHDRLRVGTRMLWYSLTDTESGEEFDGSFIGSLNRTTEDQDPAPVYFYLEYAITPYFGVGMSYDQFKVVTLDSGGGDGTFDLDGPILYGFARYENGSAFTPFAEIGVAFYGTDFNPKDEWTYSDGGSTVINRFDTDNSTGFVIAGGLDIEIIEHLSVNLYLRYVSVDIDVDYYFTPISNTTPSQTATFPGDHFAYGFGIAYTF
ncbi:MAG: hypothetical protein ACQKBT_03150 [Puniceicoccales bacterium]